MYKVMASEVPLVDASQVYPFPVVFAKSKMKGEGIFVLRQWIRDHNTGLESFGEPQVCPNRVVISGRNYFARITAGVLQNYINNLKLGTDPTPSADADVNLRAPIWPGPGQSGVFDSFTFPDIGQVTFVKRITGNEFGTEYTIQEMGAFFNDGVLFDRSISGALPVHPTNIDNVEVGLIIEWSVIF